MSAEMQDILRSLGETLERIAPAIEKLNSEPQGLPAPAPAPVASQGVADQSISPSVPQRILSFEDQLEVRSALRKRSVKELHQLFAHQAMQSDKGIPFEAWLAAGGRAREDLWGNGYSREFTPEVRKLLDSTGAAPIIRQDLEPVLYELFVRDFPAVDMFSMEPANGLTHTYQRTTTYGDAAWMPELGTVTDDAGAYERLTTNIAILATRRGVSLKSQFATIQSGSGFNPEQLELTHALRAIGHRLQYQIFSGHGTDSGGDSTNELGEYNAHAFTGLRAILNTARAKNADPYATTPDSLRQKWNQACVEIMQISPGRPSVIFMSPVDKEVFDASQDQNVRYVNELVNVAVGVNTNVVNTIFGALPLFPIPGDSISSYTAVSPAEAVRDSYILDMTSMSLPYLGSEGITTLEIPVGVSGQLTRMFILFGMWGLACKAPTYSNKVRIHVS